MNSILISLIIIIFLLLHFIIKFKMKAKEVEQINQEIINKNNEAEKELTLIEQKINLLKESYQEKNSEYISLINKIENESKLAEKSAKKYYDKMMGIYNQKLDYDLKERKKYFNTACEDYRKEYENTLLEASKDFQLEIENIKEVLSLKEEDLKALELAVADQEKIMATMVESNKRAAEMAEKENFYKMVISEDDLVEVQELRKCAKLLRNPEPLNKVIWKAYYEKPCTDLIGRVIGNGIHCGIYKITNIKNGMCYVGQAVKVAGEKLFPVTAGGLRFSSFWNIIGNNYQTAS